MNETGAAGPRRSAHTRPSGSSLLGSDLQLPGLIVVEVCSDWQLAAISATKFSNAVNLPPSAGGMPMGLTISPKEFWRDMEERWLHLARSPAFLEQISNFNAATRKLRP